ncbi:MAG: hypothetical protein DWQ02_15035, partial [Bacteroidetes bacterium]
MKKNTHTFLFEKTYFFNFLLFLFLFLNNNPAFSQCPPGHVVIQSHQDLVDFLNNYPTCTTISGDLTIGPSNDIVDLDELAGITNISGGLLIKYNTLLTDLTGLNGLSIIDNGLDINNNALLTSLPAFPNLTNINGGTINISYHPFLTSIDLSAVSSPNLYS